MSKPASQNASYLDRVLSLEVARVTERAAMAAARWIGRGDEQAADEAAVNAMRAELNDLPIDGTVVIGEGESGSAAMLYIGESVGTGAGPRVDVALDPLEGTTMTAKALPGALSVIAIAEEGTLLRTPDIYMDKIAIGGGYTEGLVDLDAPPAENIRALAAAKDIEVSGITACILDRPRNAELIAQVREAGAGIQLITDGDIAGVIDTTDPDTSIDVYMGIGGAPEGVLAASALRCIGGQMQARLVPRNDSERALAQKVGIDDLKRKYTMEEMVSGDVMFAATGVTDGSILDGIRGSRGAVTTHTLVMRSWSGTVRWIKARHRGAAKQVLS